MFEQNPPPPQEEHFHPSSGQATSVKIKQPVGKIIFVISIIVLLTALAAGGYFFWTDHSGKKELKTLTSQKESLNKEYSNPANQKIISLSDQTISRLTIFDDLYDSRIDWVKFFNLLSMESYRNLNYTSIGVDKNLAVTLAGNSPDNNSFAKAYRGWQASDLIDTVELGSFEKTESETEGEEAGPTYYTFSINLTLNREAFGIKPAEEDPATTAASTVTTTTAPAATTPAATTTK